MNRILLFLLATVAFSCAQQTHAFKISWDYNTESDIYAYHIALGISSDSSYSDSTQYLGLFYHDELFASNPDSALISVNSVLDGKWIFAWATAIDLSGNESAKTYSNIIKKDDTIAPALLRFLWIEK